MQPADKLVMMANQIARNFAIQGEERAISATAGHIQKFWDPRMREKIAAHLQSGGDGLNSVARKAVETMALAAGKV